MKKLIFVFCFLLFGCKSVCISILPEPITFTKEEQEELALIIEEKNNNTLNKVIVDYYNLRKLQRSLQ